VLCWVISMSGSRRISHGCDPVVPFGIVSGRRQGLSVKGNFPVAFREDLCLVTSAPCLLSGIRLSAF
jgi:hypothetical protein